jgi:carboxyl-terminal processing protease
MKRRSLKFLAPVIFTLLILIAPVSRAADDQAYGDIKMLLEVLNLIKDNYVQDIDTKKLVYGAASGMVHVLDPFSQFLEPDAHKEMRSETEGEFGGLGIRIAVRDGVLTVITPLPGTPAYKQGILPGDRIIKIDGDSTQDIQIEQAVKKLRGAPGSKVIITIARDGEKDLKDYTLLRELIKVESIKSKMLTEEIGYVRLTEFQQRSAVDFDAALKALQDKGMKSVVVDLRNNPGGLLNVAVDICRLFVGGNKLIVYTEGRRQPRQEFHADSSAPYVNLPMVMLVNHGSASGSEIFAGCMQDYHRAVILGSETFGKGSVQSVIPLADGSGLRLTTAKYYTPSGRTFHRDEKTGKGGITPDIIIDVSRDVEIKLQAQDEEIFNAKPVTKDSGKETIKSFKDEAKDASKDSKDKTPEGPAKDDTLDRAIQILKSQDIFSKTKN